MRTFQRTAAQESMVRIGYTQIQFSAKAEKDTFVEKYMLRAAIINSAEV